MNPATLASLITAITAFVGAVTGLIIALQHIRNHGGNGSGNTANPPGETGTVSSTKPGKA